MLGLGFREVENGVYGDLNMVVGNAYSIDLRAEHTSFYGYVGLRAWGLRLFA